MESVKTPRDLPMFSVGKRGIQVTNGNINQTQPYNILSHLIAAELISTDSRVCSWRYVKGKLDKNMGTNISMGLTSVS